MMKPGEVDRWPKPGEPPPKRPYHARVWLEVELAFANQRLERLQRELLPPPAEEE